MTPTEELGTRLEQVAYRGFYSAWVTDYQPQFKAVYTRLELVATEVFSQNGWQIISGLLHRLHQHRHSVDLIGLYCCQYVCLFFIFLDVVISFVHRTYAEVECYSFFIGLMLNFKITNAPSIEEKNTL